MITGPLLGSTSHPGRRTMEVQFWQLTLPWVLKVKLAPASVPTTPCLVHMLVEVSPLLKLSRVPPDETERLDCTNRALPNRLSATASALTLRFTPCRSTPVD